MRRTATLFFLVATAVSSSRADERHQLRRRRSLLFHEETLRSSSSFNPEPQTTVDCLYIRGDFALEAGNGSTERHEFDICQVRNGDMYDLPLGLLDDYRSQLVSGKTRVEIVGARLQPNDSNVHLPNQVILSPRGTKVRIYTDPLKARDVSSVKSIGHVTAIVVRVTSVDASVSLSKTQLSDGMFGPHGLANQMKECSAGQFVMHPGMGTDGTGVVDLFINVTTNGVSPRNLQSEIRTQFVQIRNENDYDFILYCIPKGTLNDDGNSWIAYAFRDTKFSYYNDDWCGSLTSKEHELGHNMRLSHSSEGGNAYDDYTCAMGVSHKGTDSPRMCFNGQKHWSLGWFRNNQATVDPLANGPFHGKLVAFVDALDCQNDDYVVLNVMQHLYVQYNKADKCNVGVGEKGDSVTIVYGEDPGSASIMLGGFNMIDNVYRHSINSTNTGVDPTVVVIELCAEGTYYHNGRSVRYVQLSIHEESQQSTCTNAATLLTSMEPSRTPSYSPSASPSLSLSPSQVPSLSPSLTPSLSPSLTPSQVSSLSPSQVPSLSPSQVPSLSPSQVPSFPPSQVPSLSLAPSGTPTQSPLSASNSQNNDSIPGGCIRTGPHQYQGTDC